LSPLNNYGVPLAGVLGGRTVSAYNQSLGNQLWVA
jgi:hypothetical protein